MRYGLKTTQEKKRSGEKKGHSTNSAPDTFSLPTDLDPKELAGIGFRKIAGSELLFRPNTLENEYSVLGDSRDPMSLLVAEDAQDLVDQQWSGLDDSGV
ncbi:hypothetical protein Poly51_00080 [Rubripirellula tenax]|uniref:Uncharacterized protein n=1 Tax=Rubripirellula tenax TaxID=2528015 RepID=A0A5C6FD87_9BACT|nr:hypothetical protein [Rubripirellula tenax]TWU59736.1 hypothetical protein Poly51_00080 [Rubripirellula tenax]